MTDLEIMLFEMKKTRLLMRYYAVQSQLCVTYMVSIALALIFSIEREWAIAAVWVVIALASHLVSRNAEKHMKELSDDWS